MINSQIEKERIERRKIEDLQIETLTEEQMEASLQRPAFTVNSINSRFQSSKSRVGSGRVLTSVHTQTRIIQPDPLDFFFLYFFL